MMAVKNTKPAPAACRAVHRPRRRPARTQEIARTSPPFTAWHGFLAFVYLPLIAAAVAAPGFLGDASEFVLIPGWGAAVGARVILVVATLYALFFVRAYNWITGAGLALIIPCALLRIGNAQLVDENLTITLLGYLLALSALPVRVILRPNEADMSVHFQAVMQAKRDKEGV